MANFNSTKRTAGTKARAFKVGTIVESDDVALTGQAANDTITMLTLPQGANIRGFLLYGTAALFGTSCTLQFGDGTTAARFGQIALGAVAPSTGFSCLDTSALASEVSLIITISAASGAAGAQTLRVSPIYDLNG